MSPSLRLLGTLFLVFCLSSLSLCADEVETVCDENGECGVKRSQPTRKQVAIIGGGIAGR